MRHWQQTPDAQTRRQMDNRHTTDKQIRTGSKETAGHNMHWQAGNNSDGVTMQEGLLLQEGQLKHLLQRRQPRPATDRGSHEDARCRESGCQTPRCSERSADAGRRGPPAAALPCCACCGELLLPDRLVQTSLRRRKKLCGVLSTPGCRQRRSQSRC
jgi:hypothetical protein